MVIGVNGIFIINKLPRGHDMCWRLSTVFEYTLQFWRY